MNQVLIEKIFVEYNGILKLLNIIKMVICRRP